MNPESNPSLETTEKGMLAAEAGAGEANHIDETAKLRKDLEQMKDQWLRAVADAENARKRAERELQDARKYAVGEFAAELIGVAENLFRAMESIPSGAPGTEGDNGTLLKTVHAGVDMTLKELLSIFERFGIKRLDPKGQAFNHDFHQAVAQVEDAQAKPGDVVQVIQAGYTIHGRLLRPAMVAVAKAPADTPPRVDTLA